MSEKIEGLKVPTICWDPFELNKKSKKEKNCLNRNKRTLKPIRKVSYKRSKINRKDCSKSLINLVVYIMTFTFKGSFPEILSVDSPFPLALCYRLQHLHH